MKIKLIEKWILFIESSLNRDVVLLILLLLLSRLIPHWPNFTALGAVSVLAPRWLNQSKMALIFPLLALFLSDLIIGLHAMAFYTYSSILIVSFLSWHQQDKPLSFFQVSFWSLQSSLIFYFITNFGAWMKLEMYPKTFSRLGLSYVNGLPFLLNDFLGTLVYSGIAILVLSDLSLKHKSTYQKILT